MRVKIGFVFGTVALLSGVYGQSVWEKPIAPGLIYREEVDSVRPRIVHGLRVSLHSPSVHAYPELAGGTVFEEKSLTGRAPVTQIVAGANAIAGINADFFSMENGPSGNPLGLMVRQGELVSTPCARAIFGWGPETVGTSFATFSGVLALGPEANVAIDGLNRKCYKNEVVLNTPRAGIALGDPQSTVIVLKTNNATWSPSTVVTATVASVSSVVEKITMVGEAPDPAPKPTDAVRIPVAPGQAIIVAQGTKMAALASLKPGMQIAVRLTTTGFDWAKVENVVGAGPMLLKGGMPAVDAEAEGFPSSFFAARHPRTAIGKTKDGDLWLVVVDGRQPGVSMGASLAEMASLMQHLGCDEAVNLDGGGSSAINIFGLTLNRPSDGKERPVANGVVLSGPRPKVGTLSLRISLPTKVAKDGTALAHVVNEAGAAVPNSQVLWSASGSAWIDQGGQVHPIIAGRCQVKAFADGQVLSTTIEVQGPGPKYKTPVVPTDHDPDNDPLPETGKVKKKG